MTAAIVQPEPTVPTEQESLLTEESSHVLAPLVEDNEPQTIKVLLSAAERKRRLEFPPRRSFFWSRFSMRWRKEMQSP